MKKKKTIILPLNEKETYPLTVRLSENEIEILSKAGYPVVDLISINYRIPLNYTSNFLLWFKLFTQDLLHLKLFNKFRMYAYYNFLTLYYKRELNPKQKENFENIKKQLKFTDESE